MSMDDYLKYKNRSTTTDKFTLKVPMGISEFEAKSIVSTISHIAPNTHLPTFPEFDKLNNAEKRAILSTAFSKGDHIYEFAKSLFKRYVVNQNIYPNYPTVPYMSRIPNEKNRLNTFKKARTRALSYYDARMHSLKLDTPSIINKDTPILYLDSTRNWFKVLNLLPKTQIYLPGEAMNMKQIADEYRREIISQPYSQKFQNKVFFFSLESVDEFGRYYPLQKQIEITHIAEDEDFAVSISISGIPKGNSKYIHQLIKLDSGGTHENSLPMDISCVLKKPSTIKYLPAKKKVDFKILKSATPLDIAYVPRITYGPHIHIFSNENALIYSKNPNTADTIGINDLINLYKHIKDVDMGLLSPPIRNLMSEDNRDKTYEILCKISELNHNVSHNKIDTTAIESSLSEKNFSLAKEHIIHASKYLMILDMIECMDTLIDMALNIDPVPVNITNVEHLSVKHPEPKSEFKSNRDLFFEWEKEFNKSLTDTTTPTIYTSDNDDIM